MTYFVNIATDGVNGTVESLTFPTGETTSGSAVNGALSAIAGGAVVMGR
jgi:hypothetical protein